MFCLKYYLGCGAAVNTWPVVSIAPGYGMLVANSKPEKSPNSKPVSQFHNFVCAFFEHFSNKFLELC